MLVGKGEVGPGKKSDSRNDASRPLDLRCKQWLHVLQASLVPLVPEWLSPELTFMVTGVCFAVAAALRRCAFRTFFGAPPFATLIGRSSDYQDEHETDEVQTADVQE
jgi:hypothetical protein